MFFYSFGATKNLYLCTQISNTNLNIFSQIMKKTFTILIFVLFPLLLCGQTPAFPGAEGGGMYTTGGRGGTVYYVNTLADNSSGNAATREGSLRWCLAQSGTKTILFKVSGIIRLGSRLDISANTTIAGQSAPGDGICLANNYLQIRGNNVIVRFIRCRMGDESNVEGDAFWGRNQSNIIIDHCSMSWSTDECASFYDNENFTLQWSVLSESLRVSVHGKGNHGYGGIWGGKKASFHHNLLAHHDSRNPRMCGARYSARADLELVDFRNNVIYNWGSNSGYAGEGGSYNFVNNYYQPAAGSSNTSRIFQPNADDGSNSQTRGVWGTFYVAGNRMMATNGTINTNVTNDNWNGINPNPSSKSKAEIRSDVEFAFPANIVVTTHTAEMAHEKVLAYGGASYKRDSTDRRVMNEVKNRLAPQRGSNGTNKGGLIDTQTDVGGWDTYTYDPAEVLVDANIDGIPDDWFAVNVPEGQTANDKNEEGYTYLEVYLNSLVQHIIDGQELDDHTGGGTDPGDDPGDEPGGEWEAIFCGDVPEDLVVPESLVNIITGGFSAAGGRSDGCTEDGRTWRMRDAVFTLPANSTFSAKFTGNGTRNISVTLNGDAANKRTYTLSSSSCTEVSYEFDGQNAANTIEIASRNSAGDPIDFSIINLCIQQKKTTNIKSTTTQKKPVIYYDYSTATVQVNSALSVKKISVYSIQGTLLEKISTPGVYIAHVTMENGETHVAKVVVNQ